MPDRTPQADTDRHEVRLRQQSLVAEFGLFALAQDKAEHVFAEVCRVAASGLGTQFAKLMAYDRERNDFLVVAGVGWKPGVVGQARIPSDLGSAAGYAFKTGQPVISNELTLEDRFYTPALLSAHKIIKSINVIVRNKGEPYGVLEVDSAREIDFGPHDLSFVQSLANTVAVVAERDQAVAAQRRSEALAQSVIEASPDWISVLDREGRVGFVNEAGLRLLGGTKATGRAWLSLWPEGEAARIRSLMAEAGLERAAAGTAVRCEASRPAPDGGTSWWDVSLSVISGCGGSGGERRFVAIARDITSRTESEAALREAVAGQERALADKDVLMQEVHHRVKNSLQLVQTFLNLQARGAAEPEVRAQLRDAASRVVTVGAVHDRLYKGGSVTEGDAAAYLAGLLEDLQSAVPTGAETRPMTLHAAALLLPAEQLTQLGLVMTELVTNAIKYGRGRIEVSLRTLAGGAELTVDDEGDGFAADFDPADSRGLGMRLIYAMAKSGKEALVIDRGAGHGRITCRLALARMEAE